MDASGERTHTTTGRYVSHEDNERRRHGLALSAALIAMLALSGTAAAKQCSPSAGDLSPRLTSPCAGANIRAGHNVTWKVTDNNPKAGRYHPFLNLTRQKPRHGVLPDDHNGNGIFAQMKAVKGRAGHFIYTAKKYDFPGYWLVTRGTWYVQVQQIDSTGTQRRAPQPRRDDPHLVGPRVALVRLETGERAAARRPGRGATGGMPVPTDGALVLF